MTPDGQIAIPLDMAAIREPFLEEITSLCSVRTKTPFKTEAVVEGFW